MSLKIEQRLLNHQFSEFEPRISTSGALLVPMEIEVNGEKLFIWVVDEFCDDTYLDGELISPRLISNKIEEMFVK